MRQPPLAGSVITVTGGARGIGREIASVMYRDIGDSSASRHRCHFVYQDFGDGLGLLGRGPRGCRLPT